MQILHGQLFANITYTLHSLSHVRVNNMNIEYYESTSATLVTRLQVLLDKQWEGLSQRKRKRLHSARNGISAAMAELVNIKQPLVDLYRHELETRKKTIESHTLATEKIATLKTQIEEIEDTSQEAKRLESIEDKLRAVNTDISELQARIVQLKTKQKDLQMARESTQSVIESRTAALLRQIGDLSADHLGSREIETASREAELFQDRFEQNSKEVAALTDGLVVWKDVCITVDELENGLAAQNRTSPDESKILSMLRDARQRLQRNLDMSNQNNWKLLSVAISHELAALDQGIELVSKHQMTASLSDLRYT